MTSYTVLDSIMQKFLSTKNTELESVSKKQATTLLFCLVLYFAGSISLFWKSFEVNIYQLDISIFSIILILSSYSLPLHMSADNLSKTADYKQWSAFGRLSRITFNQDWSSPIEFRSDQGGYISLIFADWAPPESGTFKSYPIAVSLIPGLARKKN